jgi:integrase
MGTIEERTNENGKKSYRAKVRLRGFPPQSVTFTKKTDAKVWIQQTETEIREGRHFNKAKSKKHTLANVIDNYLEYLEKNNPSRKKDVKTLLLWWRDEIGHCILSDLSKELFVNARKKLQNQKKERVDKDGNQYLSNSTVNRYWIAMQTALNMAVKEWEWLPINPMLHVSKLNEPEGRKRFLSDEEAKRLLQACKKSNSPYLHTIVLVALSTGARRSEILNLKWKDVDFNKNAIRLYKTKNKEARTLHLHGQALSSFQELYDNKSESDLVFPSPNNPNKSIDIKSAWEATLIRADIKDFRFHDLRHSAASYLAMNGATLAEIAEILGHKTLEMVKRYAHLTESHSSNVVKKMNEKIFEGTE